MIRNNSKKLLLIAPLMVMTLVINAGCSDIFEMFFNDVRITSPRDSAVVRYDTISVSVSWSDSAIRSVSCGLYWYDVKYGETSHTFTNISLFPGWNHISVSASGAGLFGGDSVDVYYDPSPPILTIIGPTNNSEVPSSQVTIHGMVSDNYEIVTLIYKGDGGHYGSLTFDGGTWSLFVRDLKNNTKYTFNVATVDAAGWEVVKTVSFTPVF
jgi:hypothetical protein